MGMDVSYSFLGENHESVLLVQHGMVASIKETDLFAPVLSKGISIVSIARPGYGDSSCYPLRNLDEYGKIVEDLLDHIQVSTFSGIPLLTDPRVVEIWPHPIAKGEPIGYFQDLSAHLFSWFDSSSAKDTDDVRDTRRNQYYGPALDMKIRSEDWGFPLAEIRGHVAFQHALDDDQIPFEAAKITSSLIPNAALRQRKHGGHFSIQAFQEFLETCVLPEMTETNAGS
jgi:hypothetical protein